MAPQPAQTALDAARDGCDPARRATAVAARAERDRGQASARAPLLPAGDRHPARVAGTRVWLRAAAADPRALRPRGAAGLFGGVEPAQSGAFRAGRGCGGRGEAGLRLAAVVAGGG